VVQAIVEVKGFVNKYTRPPDAEYPLHSDAYWAAVSRPEVGGIVERLMENGMQERGPLEYNLGRDIANITQAQQSHHGRRETQRARTALRLTPTRAADTNNALRPFSFCRLASSCAAAERPVG
jgi:hypothetical protein